VTEHTPSEGKQIKIIVVDDEEIVLSLCRDALEDAGYYIELANGSLDALQKIEKEYFDFILTDIRMPDMDGIELVKKARELNPSLGIIFMTGYANLNSAKDAIKEGAYDYVMKPFELNEIRQAVKNAVKKRQKDTEKTLTSELTRLSDLNQLMYTVGDRKSLVRLSLGFILMQSKSARGSFIYRTEIENEIGITSTAALQENSFEEDVLDFEKDFFNVKPDQFYEPFKVTALAQHPLYKIFQNKEMAGFLIPPWYTEGDILVNIPLSLGRKLYGLLIIGYPHDAESPKESDLKLLQITANQIAISLENITLLEETTEAYKRLKDLQEQTIQLEKMATRGQMSAEIGHELNNFLGVVIGNLSLMERHLEQKNYDELGKYLTAAINNLDNITKFSKNLMDFTDMTSKFASCDINALIGDIIDYLKSQKHFEDIEVEFDNSTLSIFAEADGGQLQQLLYNLINNAADAVREKKNQTKKRIVIATRHNADDRNYTISVSDNGVGMPEDLVQSAFQKQFTTKKTGHGFGLLVCSRIISNHKGDLKIDSTQNEGTTINISFPLSMSIREKEPAY